MTRPEARTLSVLHTRVKRNADHRDIGMGDLVGAGQAGEGGGARIARHAGGVDRSDRVL